MALGFLESGGGGSSAWLQWKAEAVRWEAGVGSEKSVIEFTEAIMDIENIQIGYGGYVNGKYDYVLSADLNNPPAQPNATVVNQNTGKEENPYKQAFEIKVFAPNMFGEEHPIRSFKSTSKSARTAVNRLHTEYTEQSTANPGKVPVVAFLGHEYIEGSNGYKGINVPKFSIVKWVDRPEALNVQTSSPATATPQAAVAEEPVQNVASSGGSNFF